MADCCEISCAPAGTDLKFRNILWICLIINFVMFGVEIVAGWLAGSVSLQANALDFLGDGANYIISL